MKTFCVSDGTEWSRPTTLKALHIVTTEHEDAFLVGRTTGCAVDKETRMELSALVEQRLFLMGVLHKGDVVLDGGSWRRRE